jgi:hypothetical protein
MYRVMILHDIELKTERGPIRWAYANRSLVLWQCAPIDFHVERAGVLDAGLRDRLSSFDLIFLLDYASAPAVRNWWSECGISAPLVIGINKDTRSHERQCRNAEAVADWVIFNSSDRYLNPRVRPRTSYIANGVSDFWGPYLKWPPGVLWCGSSNPAKKKRYQEVIKPLGDVLEREGIDFDFRPIDEIDDKVFTPEEQRAWYQSGCVAICASESEGGGPSFLQEAAACGLLTISTNVGNVKDWAPQPHVIYDGCPGLDTWLFSIKWAIGQPKSVHAGILQQMQNHLYSGPNGRSRWFFQLFRRLIEAKAASRPFDSIDSFDYRTKHFSEI